MSGENEWDMGEYTLLVEHIPSLRNALFTLATVKYRQ